MNESARYIKIVEWSDGGRHGDILLFCTGNEKR
jgi:hypothetical protein